MKPAPHLLEAANLSHFWAPFTANRQCKVAPRLSTSAQGMYYRDNDGREVLDDTASLWCINAGRYRKRIVDAITTQAATLDFMPAFQIGHPLAFRATEKAVEIMPEGLNRISFTNSGSGAVDMALEIALVYHHAQGEGWHTRLIGRERGYHGVSFGGISVSGISPNRKAFSTNLLPDVDCLPHTHTPEHNAFSKDQPTWGEHLAGELERLVTLHDTSIIVAVIVELLASSAGVLVPPKGYLQRLRVLCDKHGILLTFNEVITGFGYLGVATATELFGVTPDLLTMAKSINNTAVPMGAVAMRRSMHDAVVDAGAPGAVELFHGYTYSAHPLAAIAAVAALDLYRSEGLLERTCSLSPAFGAAAHSVKSAPHMKDIRNLGLVVDIELESRPDAVGARAYEVFLKCLGRGVLVHYAGDILAFFPPLIIEEAQIARIFNTVRTVL